MPKSRVALLSVALTFLGTSTALAASTTPQTIVTSAITSAITNNSIPSSITPSLSSVATPQLAYVSQGASLVYKCAPGSHPQYITKPKPCWLGSSTGATWVLWGDSNAAAWIPALAQVATARKVRLAVFVYPGCTSQFASGSEFGTAVRPENCAAFHRALPLAVKALTPKVVLSAIVGFGFSGKQADVPVFATAWKNTFDAITSGKANIRRVLLGTTPNLGGRNIAACLAASKDRLLLPCSPHYVRNAWTGFNYWTYVQRDITSATTANATLIPVDSLFCETQGVSLNQCPAIVANKLVYVDADHVSIAYMNYIAPALSVLFRTAGL